MLEAFNGTRYFDIETLKSRIEMQEFALMTRMLTSPPIYPLEQCICRQLCSLRCVVREQTSSYAACIEQESTT